jgi:predicted lactoylglutathione lyase
VEIGAIILAASLQRTRAATELMFLLMRHVFDDLGYRRYEWKCDSLNEPSRRAATRLGFTHEGRFRHHTVVKGRNRDTDWFSVTAAEWPTVRAAHERWLDPANFDADGCQLTALSELIPRLTVGRPCHGGPMDQRISFVTLAVADVALSEQFYCGGLGWTPQMYVEGEVLMIRVGAHVVLSLWDRAAFEAEVGPIAGGAAGASGVPPVTLAHNVRTREEVDAILRRARELGAGPVTAGQEREWGGYTGSSDLSVGRLMASGVA